MTKTILISVTAFTIMVGAWTVNLVCNPPAPGNAVAPLAPISIVADWR